jgi:hypothetical protein
MLIIKCSICKCDVDVVETIETRCKVHYEGYYGAEELYV